MTAPAVARTFVMDSLPRVVEPTACIFRSRTSRPVFMQDDVRSSNERYAPQGGGPGVLQGVARRESRAGGRPAARAGADDAGGVGTYERPLSRDRLEHRRRAAGRRLGRPGHG